jgi:hypothetical protein
MLSRKFLNLIVSVAAIAALVGGPGSVTAMPMNPTDETKVPHYFGPNPNWANSPFTKPDAQVVITGDGTGATAEATVGTNGAITAITLTNGGHNYSNAKVDIFGSGTGATADVTIVKKGAVVAVNVDPLNQGSGYTAPVTFSRAAQRRPPTAALKTIFRSPAEGAAIRSRRWSSTCPTRTGAFRPRATLYVWVTQWAALIAPMPRGLQWTSHRLWWTAQAPGIPSRRA